MKWRTDKPTADVIVAKFNNIYEILNRDEQGNYFLQDGFVKKVVPIEKTEKWADLEEEETVTDNKERIEYLAKAVKILGELGYNRTASLVNDVRIELKGNKKGTDVAVMESNELSDEIHKV